jgi:hypothetical protein
MRLIIVTITIVLLWFELLCATINHTNAFEVIRLMPFSRRQHQPQRKSWLKAIQKDTSGTITNQRFTHNISELRYAESADIIQLEDHTSSVTDYIHSLRKRAQILREEAAVLESSWLEQVRQKQQQQMKHVDQWISDLFEFDIIRDIGSLHDSNLITLNHTFSEIIISNNSLQEHHHNNQRRSWWQKLWSRRYYQKVFPVESNFTMRSSLPSSDIPRSLPPLLPPQVVSHARGVNVTTLTNKLYLGRYSESQLLLMLERLYHKHQQQQQEQHQQHQQQSHQHNASSLNESLTWTIGSANMERRTIASIPYGLCIKGIIDAALMVDQQVSIYPFKGKRSNWGKMGKVLQSKLNDLIQTNDFQFHQQVAATILDSRRTTVNDNNETYDTKKIKSTQRISPTQNKFDEAPALSNTSVFQAKVKVSAASIPLWVPSSLLQYVVTCKDHISQADMQVIREKVLSNTDFFCTSTDSIPNAAIFRGTINSLQRLSTRAKNVKQQQQQHQHNRRSRSISVMIVNILRCKWETIKINALLRDQRRSVTTKIFADIQYNLVSSGLRERIQLFFLLDPEWRPHAHDQNQQLPVILALPSTVKPMKQVTHPWHMVFSVRKEHVFYLWYDSFSDSRALVSFHLYG